MEVQYPSQVLHRVPRTSSAEQPPKGSIWVASRKAIGRTNDDPTQRTDCSDDARQHAVVRVPQPSSPPYPGGLNGNPPTGSTFPQNALAKKLDRDLVRYDLKCCL